MGLIGKLKREILEEEEREVMELVFEDATIDVHKYAIKYTLLPFIPAFFFSLLGYAFATVLFGEFIGTIVYGLGITLYMGLYLIILLFMQYKAQGEAGRYYTMVVHCWINDRAYPGILRTGAGGIREVGKFNVGDFEFYVYVFIPVNRIKFFDRSIRDYVDIDAFVIATPDKWNRTFAIQADQPVPYKNFQVRIQAAHGDLEFRGIKFYGDVRVAYWQAVQSSWFAVRRSETVGLVDVVPTPLQPIEEKYIGEELVHLKLAYIDMVNILSGMRKETEEISTTVNEAVRDSIRRIIDMENLAQKGEFRWRTLLIIGGMALLGIFVGYLILYGLGLI